MASLASKNEYSPLRLKQLVLLVTKLSEKDRTVGRVKLAKLLYYIDMECFLLLGHSMSNATYQKLPQGPAPREFLGIKAEMFRDNWIDEVSIQAGPHTRQKLVAVREPDTSVFDANEQAIVERVVNEFWEWSATKISDYAHDEIGWISAEMKADIPNEAYLLSANFTEDEMKRAEKIAQEHHLCNA
jgi:uncharacterized phage-associated protein